MEINAINLDGKDGLQISSLQTLGNVTKSTSF